MSVYKNMETPGQACDVIDTSSARVGLNEDRSLNDVFAYLGDLFGKLTSDLSELFNLHMDLLKAEIRDSGKTLMRDSAMLIVAAVLGWFALTGFTLALIAVIAGLLPIESQMMALAAGAAIVGVAYAVIAAGLAFAGINHLKKRSLAPDRTMQEVKLDKDAVKEMK